jgi:hypothetical protein
MSITPCDGLVTILSEVFGEPVPVDRDSTRVDRILPLPTGRHEVRFISNTPRRYPSSVAGERVFVVENFRLTPVRSPVAESPPVIEPARK